MTIIYVSSLNKGIVVVNFQNLSSNLLKTQLKQVLIWGPPNDATTNVNNVSSH
jgi:hypothetical protein